jgi:hypothetical protein
VQSSIEKAHRIFSAVVVGEEEEQRPRAVEVTFCCLQKERKGAAGSRAKKREKEGSRNAIQIRKEREISSHVPRGVEFHERAL